jgi:type II secretory pathway component PulF
MPEYKYKAVNKYNETSDGWVDAVDRNEAINKLRLLGLKPLKVDEGSRPQQSTSSAKKIVANVIAVTILVCLIIAAILVYAHIIKNRIAWEEQQIDEGRAIRTFNGYR